MDPASRFLPVAAALLALVGAPFVRRHPASTVGPKDRAPPTRDLLREHFFDAEVPDAKDRFEHEVNEDSHINGDPSRLQLSILERLSRGSAPHLGYAMADRIADAQRTKGEHLPGVPLAPMADREDLE